MTRWPSGQQGQATRLYKSHITPPRHKRGGSYFVTDKNKQVTPHVS